MKEKSAFGGWFLMWVIAKMMTFFAFAGKTSQVDDLTEYMAYMDYEGKFTYYADLSGSIPEPKEIFIEWADTMPKYVSDYFNDLIAFAEECPCNDPNFKNTLVVCVKEWKKVI